MIAATSALLTHDARHTWAKAFDEQTEAVEVLNTNSRASLVSDDFVGGLLAFSRRARGDLRVSWHARCFSCPRVYEPHLDVPFSAGKTGDVYFFRSWVNIPVAILKPLVVRMASDQLDAPRFHTSLVPVTPQSGNLFLLAPR